MKLLCDRCGYVYRAGRNLKVGDKDICPGKGTLVEVTPIMEIVLKRERAWMQVADARGELMRSMMDQAQQHGLVVSADEHGIYFKARQTVDT